jgi:glutamate dehydrogenase/leucine dehydrogenase
LSKEGNALTSKDMLSFEEIDAKIWDLQAEVFLPCASSRLVTQSQVQRMIDSGLEVVSSGANVPFADKEIFYGPIAAYVDSRVSVIPDFISNCGMARVFAFLMGEAVIEDEEIFKDTSATIRKAIADCHALNPSKTKLTETAFSIALKKLI